MKKLLLSLLLVVFVTACASQQFVEEGLVNHPDVGNELFNENSNEEIFNEDLGEPVDTLQTDETTEEVTTTEEVMTTEEEDTTTIEVTTTTESAATTTTVKSEPVGDTLSIKEGDKVKLNLKATDPDNNPLTYTFSSPLDENGEWKTAPGDAGVYNIIVTASDGQLSTIKNIKIIVESSNKLPQLLNLESIKSINAVEGDEIYINTEVTDEDGDNVQVSFSGFMEKSRYQSGFSDAGEHQVVITLDDGKEQVRETITISISNKNRVPEIQAPEVLRAVEEEIITLNANVVDPDGDNVAISFSEPMDSDGKWITQRGDAGTYDVTIKANDGFDETTKVVSIELSSLNVAPVLAGLENIMLNEGQTVILSPDVSDADNDEVTISYSGWMTSNVYETSFDDSGTHIVTVTASDGIDIVTQDVMVTIIDVNRPPQNLVIDVEIVEG